MQKTRKYIIETSIADSVITKVEVSKTAFEKALKDTEKQYNAQESGGDFYVERDTQSKECESVVENIIMFDWSASSIWFRELICKEGYVFKK